MGHSGGSFIGIQAAARAPEKYTAYIGIGQIANQAQSEQLADSYMLGKYTDRGDTRAVQKLRKFAVPTADTDALLAYFFSMTRDNPMHELGIGTMRSMRSVVSGVLLPSLQSREYTLRQKLNIWRGKFFLQGSTGVGREMLTTNLSARITRFDIPVYFMSGLHDYTVARPLSSEYLAAIQAPLKGFYTFASSAHSPLFEEPEAFLRVMTQDALRGRSNLADRE